MKYIEVIEIMKIEIINENDQVFIKYNDCKELFSFEIMDKLIDLFVNDNDVKIEDCDESLSKYKELVSKIYNETQTDGFKKAYSDLSKKDITNDELFNIIKNNQIDNEQYSFQSIKMWIKKLIVKSNNIQIQKKLLILLK